MSHPIGASKSAGDTGRGGRAGVVGAWDAVEAWGAVGEGVPLDEDTGWCHGDVLRVK